MTSVQLNDPEKSLSETLSSVAKAIQGERITLHHLLHLIGEQGLLVFCMFLTIPFLLPVSIPGISTVFGLVITLIGVGVALNRVPWLPRRLMDKAIDTTHLIPALERGAHLFARLDSLIRPRMLALTHGATVNRFNGLLLIGGAILLMVPLGLIPFSNTLPALAILCLAAGMLQRDGLFVALGYVTMLGTVAYFSVLVLGTLMAGHGLSQMLSVIILF
jgi:hypothetical protein